MSSSREDDESFFLELERATQGLSIAEGKRTTSELKLLFDLLRAEDQASSIELEVGTKGVRTCDDPHVRGNRPSGQR